MYENLMILFAVLGAFFGLIKWVGSKNELLQQSLDKAKEDIQKNITEAEKEVLKVATRAHTRIDDLPKEYVRREELMAHLRTVEARIEGLGKNIDGVSRSVDRVASDSSAKLAALQDTLTEILRNVATK